MARRWWLGVVVLASVVLAGCSGPQALTSAQRAATQTAMAERLTADCPCPEKRHLDSRLLGLSGLIGVARAGAPTMCPTELWIDGGTGSFVQETAYGAFSYLPDREAALMVFAQPPQKPIRSWVIRPNGAFSYAFTDASGFLGNEIPAFHHLMCWIPYIDGLDSDLGHFCKQVAADDHVMGTLEPVPPVYYDEGEVVPRGSR